MTLVQNEESAQRHQDELEAQRAQVKALMKENAKLLASNTDLLTRASQLSTEGIPSLDDVMASATYGLVEPTKGPANASTFLVQTRSMFPLTHFRGESSNAANQPTTQKMKK